MILMKNLFFLLVTACFLVVPGYVHAAANPYASLSGAASLMCNSSENGVPDAVTYKTGYRINGAAGLSIDCVRVEAEVGYHRNELESYVRSWTPPAYVSQWSFMANGYLDCKLKDAAVSPYIMAGIGFANVSWDEPDWKDSQTVFAWQIGAGAGIRAADKVMFDIGYRYFKPNDVTFKDGYTNSFGSSAILAGIRIGL